MLNTSKAKGCLLLSFVCAAALLILPGAVSAAEKGVPSKVQQYKDALKKQVSVSIDRSPDGGKLTAQFAVMGVCDAAGVPYQFQRSHELTGGKSATFIKTLVVTDVAAEKAITDILSPLGLAFGIDENGLYLQKPGAAPGKEMEPAPRTKTPVSPADGFEGQMDLNVRAEDLVLRDLDGRSVRVLEAKDAIVVVGLGMSWCAGCPPEGQALSKMWADFASQKVRFLYLDRGETPRTALDFAKHCRFAFPALLCTSYDTPRAYQAGNPGISVVDRKGNLRMKGTFTEIGAEELLRRKLTDLVKEQPSSGVVLEPSSGVPSFVKSPVAAEGWSPAALVSSEGTRAYQPSVAADPRGGIYVAWAENALENGEIALRRFDGKNWLAVERPFPSRFDDYSPRLAANAAGTVCLAWVSNAGGKYAVWSAFFDGKRWSEPVIVGGGVDDCFHPSLACDDKGKFWAAWYAWSTVESEEQTGGKAMPYRSVYASSWEGKAWAPQAEVSHFSYICNDHWDPEIAIDAKGAPLVCWAKDNWNDPAIFSSSLTGGAWSDELSVSSREEEAPHDPARPFRFVPSLTKTPDGTVWAFWQERNMQSRDGWQIRFARLSDGKWTEPERLTRGAGENCAPAAAAGGSGSLFVFWSTLKKPGGDWGISFSRRKGTSWDEPKVVVTGGSNINPATCTDASGKVWLVWQSGQEGNWSVYAASKEKSD